MKGIDDGMESIFEVLRRLENKTKKQYLKAKKYLKDSVPNLTSKMGAFYKSSSNALSGSSSSKDGYQPAS